MKTYPLVAVLLLLATSISSQTPQSAASIDGVVVNLNSAQPMDRVVVELGSMAPQRIGTPSQLQLPPGVFIPNGMLIPSVAPLTITTSTDGRFSFADVPPGEYRLYATRGTTDVPAEYGQRSPVGKGMPLVLGSGQKVSGIRLSMIPTGSIVGRVVDPDGDPVDYARVDLLRTAYLDGTRILVIAQTATTDDRGEYRLPMLSPGRYYISVRPAEIRSRAWPSNSEPARLPNRFAMQQVAIAPLVTKRVLDTGELVEEAWLPVYYPGTTDFRSAGTVSLDAGNNRTVTDISLTRNGVPARHVRGVVLNGGTNLPAGGATVRMVPQDPLTPSIMIPSGTTDDLGQFDLYGVLSKTYSLIVSGPVTGYMVLSVGASDVDGLTINGLSGVDIPWRAAIEGSPDERTAASRLRITLNRDPVIFGAPSGVTVITAGWPGVPPVSIFPQSQPLAAGGFAMRNVSLGDYRVSITGLPQDTYIKSISTGRTDVLRDGLHVAGVLENPLEIVLGNNTGSLAGRIVNGKQQGDSNVTVVLVPNPQLRFRSDLYRSVTTDSSGRFRMDGIAPGEYKLLAWEEVADGAWRDSDFMRDQETRGVPVNIQPGKNETSNVVAIPWSISQ